MLRLVGGVLLRTIVLEGRLGFKISPLPNTYVNIYSLCTEELAVPDLLAGHVHKPEVGRCGSTCVFVCSRSFYLVSASGSA